MKTTLIRMLTTALILAGASAASAQSSADTPFFLNLNGGGQWGTRSIETSSSTPLYGETLVINSAQEIGSGPLLDASAGYRFPRGLAFAIGYSSFGRSSDATLVASVPDPLVFNHPTTKTATATDLKHIENGWHVMIMWFFPVTDKIDLAVFGGPSFIGVKQDVPVGSGADLSVVKDRQTGTAKGFNIGATGTMMFMTHVGIDAFVRYAGGSVDLPAVSKLKVGGPQAGGGLHFRF